MKFKEKVIEAIGSIPKGKLVSYGQVAAACGSPRAARQVGWMLHTLDGDNTVPWWRVINNLGYISIKGNFMSTPLAQKKFLEDEGIEVTKDMKIDIEKYRYYFSPARASKKSRKRS
jgi:methylated-DNA-protein-cysteine methyltransferase related protein